MDDNLPLCLPIPCPEVKDLLKYKLEEINKPFLCCGGTRLHHLLIKGSSEETLQLLKKGKDVNLRNADGLTALMVAVAKKSINSDIVKIIAENTSDLNVIYIDGKAALNFAVSSGNFEAVQIPLQFGANIDIQNRLGNSPLHTACYHHLDLVETLVEHGANVGVKNNEGATPLHLAVGAYKNGSIDVGRLINTIDILLDKGANINEQTKDGKTVLHILGRFWDTNLYLNELHTFLLDKGAQVHLQDKYGITPLYLDIEHKGQYLRLMLRTESGKSAVNIPNSQGNYPLLLATERKDFEMVRLLLDNGAVIDIKNKFEETPLYLALKMESEPIFSLLIDRGAQVSCQDKFMRTPLHIATEVRSSQQKVICTTLLAKGASPNVQDESGITPLHNAVENNSNDIVQVLLENGAEVNIKNKRGETPLHISTRHSRGTDGVVQDLICSTLIEKEALINAQVNDRMTPLHNAVTCYNTNIVQLLLENGAEVNSKNKNEETPLHLSTRQCSDSNLRLQKLVCTTLLVKGASPNAQDVYGMTPLHNAAKNYKTNLIHLLLENGADINSKNNKGETPLHVSTLRCHDIHRGLQELTCSTLLAKGALINVQDDFGMTPLHNAVRSYTVNIVQLLLENGAEINKKNKKGESPIRYVRSVDMLEILLQKGAEVNEQDNYGQTALHTIAKDYQRCLTNRKSLRRLRSRELYATSKVVKLLEWGASPNIRDNSGKLPFEYYSFTDAQEEYEIKRTCLYSIHEIKKGSSSYKFQRLRKSCCEEVDRMKRELLGKNSLYDIFRHYDDPNFLSNTELESAILFKDLKVKFPIYCSTLISTYRRSRERVQLFDHVTDILQTKLPFEVMRCILTLVDDDSLRNVIKAKEEFSVNGESDSTSATKPDLELNFQNECDSEYESDLEYESDSEYESDWEYESDSEFDSYWLDDSDSKYNWEFESD